jgi:homogentisate 1,2-dioxygenase
MGSDNRMKSWIHLNKGVTPRQAHVNLPDGLKEEEIGRGGFMGQVAELYRRHEPTKWVRVEGDGAPGDVDGKKLDAPDRTDARAEPARAFWNDDVTISISRRSEAMPYYLRDSDGDTLYFVHKGKGTLETEFGPLAFSPGDYLIIPKGITYRVVPEGKDNYFLVMQSVQPIELVDFAHLGRHNPYDPTVIVTPEPREYAMEGKKEWEVKVRRDGRFTSFFYDRHPIDTVGWKGDLFPYRFHNTDFRPVTADRNHIPPSAFGLFKSESFWVCNFVPHPAQMEKGVLRLPYYHRNVDFDEIGFLHAGTMGGNPIEEATIMWHPRGAVHGPGEDARAMADAAWDSFKLHDIQAVNIDVVKPFKLSDQVRAAMRDQVQLITGGK